MFKKVADDAQLNFESDNKQIDLGVLESNSLSTATASRASDARTASTIDAIELQEVPDRMIKKKREATFKSTRIVKSNVAAFGYESKTTKDPSKFAR